MAIREKINRLAHLVVCIQHPSVLLELLKPCIQSSSRKLRLAFSTQQNNGQVSLAVVFYEPAMLELSRAAALKCIAI